MHRVASSDDVLRMVAGRPDGEGWVCLADADDAAIFDGWFDRIRATIPNGRADVAGSYLASFLAGAIATPLVRALVEQDRAWRTTADTTWVHAHDDGWIDGVAIGATVLVLPADPAAGRDDVDVVAGVEELRTLAIEHLVSVVDPLFAEVRARAPYGLRGMWGALADSMASDLTWVAHVEGRDVVAAWQSVQPALECLAAAAPRPLTRPTFERIEVDGDVAHLSIRGTCCLYYQSQREGAPIDYCSSCPMGSQATQRLRRQDWLGREVAARRARVGTTDLDDG